MEFDPSALRFEDESRNSTSSGSNELQKKQESNHEKEKENRCKSNPLSIKVQSVKEFKFYGDGQDEDGNKTPTSADEKIPGVPKCPAAPRKPKSLPSAKRKASQAYLDLSSEVESLFPPALRMDLRGKIKKARGC